MEQELIYPKLSYKIVGILFDVYNSLGYGHKEKIYENAVAVELEKCGLQYRQQVYVPVKHNGEIVGKYFLDILIGEKVVLELKRGARFTKGTIEQVYEYLQANDLKLGIIAQFAPKELKFKRIINVRPD